MLRRAMSALYFSFILIAMFTQPAFGYAETQILFEKNVKVRKWHLHLSHHRFELDHPTSAILRVTKIAPDKQINGGFVLFNGRLIFLRGFLGGSKTVYEEDVELKTANRLFVFLRGTPGAALNLQVSGSTAPQPPDIITFAADPPSVKIGQTSTLNWQTQNVLACRIDPGGIDVKANGSMPVSPAQTTTYTITAAGEGNPATATVVVTVENSAPVAVSQNFAIDEDTAASILLTGSDADGDQLLFTVQTEPRHGGLTGAAPDLTYQPAANYHGEDEFSFTVHDGKLTSQPATVHINIQAVNDVPVADAGADQSVFAGDAVRLSGSGSTDADGDTLG